MSELPPKKIPKGWYQKLLCQRCEIHFSQFDEYGTTFIKSVNSWQEVESTQVKCFEVFDYDYSMLKLFVLSILWRAAVAQREPFTDFSILPARVARLQEMLQAKNPGASNEFPLAIFKYADDGRHLNKIVKSPTITKARDCIRLAVIQLNEFVCHINLTERDASAMYEGLWLTDEVPLRIMEVSPERKIAEAERMTSAQHKRHAEFRAKFKK